jgi:hypothetical protein
VLARWLSATMRIAAPPVTVTGRRGQAAGERGDQPVADLAAAAHALTVLPGSESDGSDGGRPGEPIDRTRKTPT